MDRRHPLVWVPLSVERTTELADGRPVSTSSGWAIVSLNAAADVAQLGTLITAAYEHVKAAHGSGGGETDDK
jgi:hypothetical protein